MTVGDQQTLYRRGNDRGKSLVEIALTMGRLGCVAFGGPVAHLACFRNELVERRRWLSDEDFVDLVAFCQFLPGPASSQVGMGIGLRRGGLLGMLVAWFCFTMPSVVVLVAAAAGLGVVTGYPMSWLHGLLAGVVAIVADAVVKMGAKVLSESIYDFNCRGCHVADACRAHGLDAIVGHWLGGFTWVCLAAPRTPEAN